MVNVAERIKRAAQRERILKTIERRPVEGFTCDEVEERLCMLHQTASARIAELKHCGVVYESGMVRKTRTGKLAMVIRPARQCGVGRPRRAA